jgi:hypothetical protein
MRPDNEIDRLILSFATTSPRKIALIVAKTMEAAGEDGDESFAKVLARLQALVAAGRLHSAGDLSRPRHAEVCLPE